MAVTADKVVTILQANVDSHVANINKAEANFSTKVDAMAADAAHAAGQVNQIGTAANKAFGGIASQAPKATTAIRGASVQTGNLAAQINDIGVQLAGGQSPFLIAIQQGSQINQVIGQAGAGGAVRALGAAFTSLINPVSLATFAVIGLAGAAIQYFTGFLEGSEDNEKALKKEKELIDRVAAAWGDALPALRAYLDERERLLDESELKDASERLARRQFAGVSDSLQALEGDFLNVISLMENFGAPKEDIKSLTDAFDTLQKKIKDGTATTTDLNAVTTQLMGFFKTSGNTAVLTMASSVAGLAAQLQTAANNATNLRSEAELMVDFFKRSPLGQLSPLTSGGGGFLDPQELFDFKAAEARFAELGDSAAAIMIKKFEGFRPDAYWDVNAFRAGFGSDTVTKAGGEVEKVTKDTVVTLADANRDLARRLGEFQDTIRDQIGGGRFDSFTEEQKAALTSIAYNYGQLPDRIIGALKSGSPDGIANAIAGLAADNGGINKKRRLQEAATFSSTGMSGLDAASKKKTPSEIFSGDLASVERKIALINAEYEAQARLNPLIKDYGYEVEKAKIKQDLLNDAKKAGLEITPELASKIDTLAENYAKATAAREQLTESQKKAAETAKEFSELGKDVLGGFIRDLVAGKSAADALADALGKIADKLLDMALEDLFSGGGSGGGGFLGALSGILGGLFKAKGGPVRKGQPYVVGEKRPELFIPDQSGTIMPSVPKMTMPSRGGSGQPGGGFLQVTTVSEVINGNLVPTMTQVAGLVGGQQIKQANRQLPSRLASSQQRGT